MTVILEVDDLSVSYGSIVAVRNINLKVNSGEVVGLIGPNGAGKTSTLGAISGLLKPSGGSVRFKGETITGNAPDAMLRSGLALVPEHRRLFGDLTVKENLLVGGVSVSAKEREQRIAEAYDLFPVLAEKSDVSAGYLSGGQAQQLAIGRALMSNPELILMDEPSLGLAPTLVDVVFELVDKLRDEGRTLLIVEQNATRMLKAADRAYVMRSGGIAVSGTGEELRSRSDIFEEFVGNA